MSHQALADINKTLNIMSMLPLFGVDPQEMMGHFNVAQMCPEFYRRPCHGARHWGPRNLDLGSKITSDKDQFQVMLEVRQFAPTEISVKVVGDQIVVEGKHEEKEDEHGFIARHFVRKYHVPIEHRAEDVVSTLSSDGVLTITAPKKVVPVEGERLVPIMATGPAHHAVHNKPKDAQCAIPKTDE